MTTKEAIKILKELRKIQWSEDSRFMGALDVIIENYPNNDILVNIHDSIPNPSTYCDLWRLDLENQLAFVKWALYSYSHIYAK